MFDPSFAHALCTKGTLPMACFANGKKIEQARPKGRIVGKDRPRQPYRDLLLLPDGRVLVAYSGRFIGSDFGLQVRKGPDLKVTVELAGAAGPFSLRGDGLLLTSGPLAEGHEASMNIVDLGTLSIVDTFPVCQPYLWLAGKPQRFVAQTPAFPDFAERPHVDPALVGRHPHLRRWVEDHARRLLLIGPSGKAVRTLDASAVGPEYPEFKGLALSPDGAILYSATERSVAAISVSDWSIRWRTQLGDNAGPRFFVTYAMALSMDGHHLAIGGLAGYAHRDRTLTVLNAKTGKLIPTGNKVGLALGHTSIHSLAWHPTGWLVAGTASGRVAHVDIDGTVRTYKGAAQGIESLLFIDEGRSLLLCGAEKHFRVLPLLNDEAGSAPRGLPPHPAGSPQ